MQIISDNYMVVVEQEFDVVKMKSGLLSLNAAYFEKDQESKYKFKNQSGIVVGIPPAFTDKPFDVVDTGIPQRRKFISSEFIQTMVNQGYKKLPVYWPTTFDDPEIITMSDLGAKMTVKVGDKVYFDYAVTDEDHSLGKHEGKNMFRAEVHEIYCSVRRVRSRVDFRYRDQIIMQGGWVLVEPDVDTWEEIKTEGGLFRKPKPQAKSLLGFVRHIGIRSDLKSGDHIVYVRNADYVVPVEGKIYFVMREEDILCRI